MQLPMHGVMVKGLAWGSMACTSAAHMVCSPQPLRSRTALVEGVATNLTKHDSMGTGEKCR